mmetsp:Transcript_41794/g.96798  ORF Transcript_41794/g.96798 Transcript_41794/m.96798 type:complete len:249 (+) Transcript_41794:1804-2550(+)
MLAKGAGSCPGADGPERLEYKPCNQLACAPTLGQPVLQCDSALDVILLLAGAPKQATQAEAMRAGSELLVRAFRGSSKVQLGVLSLSGLRSVEIFKHCAQGPELLQQTPHPDGDCGVQWVSHLTGDLDAVTQKVSGLQLPRGTPLASAALTTSLAELRLARRDARSVIVVLTGVQPLSPRLTGQVAEVAKRRSRLVWIPVTRSASCTALNSWCSPPVHENVLQVDDFEALAKPETISKLVSNICPKVK